MKHKILILSVFTCLFITSCKENAKQENVSQPVTNEAVDSVQTSKNEVSPYFLQLVKQFHSAGYVADTTKKNAVLCVIEDSIMLYEVPLKEHYISTIYEEEKNIAKEDEQYALRPISKFSIKPFENANRILSFVYKQAKPQKVNIDGVVDEFEFTDSIQAQQAYDEIVSKAHMAIFFKTGGLICLKANYVYLFTSRSNSFVWEQRPFFKQFVAEIQADKSLMFN